MTKLLLLLVLVVLSLEPSHAQRGDDCGLGYGCFSAPANCLNQTDASACDFVFKYKIDPVDPSLIDFILAAKVENPESAYLAIGFAHLEQMSNSSIVMCKYHSERKIQAVENQYAITQDKPELIDSTQPSLGIWNAKMTMVNSVFTCEFSRLVKPPNGTFADKFFDIGQNDTIHILAAKGNLDDEGNALYHYKRGCSPFKIDFESTESSSAIFLQLNVSLVKAHGSLMLIAWAFLASVGILLPRYMKFLFPKRKFFQVDFWFFTHRMFMTGVPVISLIAFIIIFAAKDWHWAFPDETKPLVHTITGLLTITFSLIQTMGGFFRPDKTDRIRPIFNWGHRILGIGTFFLSVATVSIAFNFVIPGKNWALVFAWVIWVIVVPSVFEILDAKKHRVSVLTNVSADGGVKLEEEEQDSESVDKMKIVLFVVHFVVQIIITVALVDYVLFLYG